MLNETTFVFSFGPEDTLAWAHVLLARLGILFPRAARNSQISPCHLLAAVSEKKCSHPSRPWVIVPIIAEATPAPVLGV